MAEDRNQDAGASMVFWLLATLVASSAVGLGTVLHPGVLTMRSPDPTPYGYTWSLTFFLLPIAMIVGWLHLHHRARLPMKAFWWTIGILAPLGFLLDTLFGLLFFNFQNHGATVRFHLYAYDWDAHAFARSLPVEEFGFYLFGFIAILSTYLWLDENFLGRYKTDVDDKALDQFGPVARFHWQSLALAVGLLAVSVVYKKLGPAPDGFPGWMAFLLVIGLTPAVGFYKSAAPYINWRAFAITCVLMALVSVIWEATLAVPYGWWGYNERQMVGVFVGAWAGLPIEQPVLWVLVTYTTMIVYVTVKIVLQLTRRGRSVTGALLGARGGRA